MSTKNVFVFAALLAISNPAKAEPTIVCGSATVTLPNRFSVVKKQTGDCPGLLITVHDRVLGRDFELKLGDDFTSRSLQLSPDDLKDLEYFQREPGSWLGYQFVVLRRREMRQDKEGEKQQVELLAFEMRRPVENAYLRVKVPKGADIRPIRLAMKSIKVDLTAGYLLEPSEDERSFALYPPRRKPQSATRPEAEVGGDNRGR